MRNRVIVVALLLVALVLIGLCSASMMEVDWQSLIEAQAAETPNLWPIWDGYEAPSPY